MWVLSLSYYDDSGSFYRSKFIIYKDKEKAEEEGNKEIENFREEALEMIQLYQEQQIICEVYDRLDIYEIENILSDNTTNEEEKVKYLTNVCNCCFSILPIELNMDSDIVLEHSFQL